MNALGNNLNTINLDKAKIKNRSDFNMNKKLSSLVIAIALATFVVPTLAVSAAPVAKAGQTATQKSATKKVKAATTKKATTKKVKKATTKKAGTKKVKKVKAVAK